MFTDFFYKCTDTKYVLCCAIAMLVSIYSCLYIARAEPLSVSVHFHVLFKHQRAAGTATTFAVQPPSSAPVSVAVTSATPQPAAPTATTTTANTGQKPDLLGGLDDPFGESKINNRV